MKIISFIHACQSYAFQLIFCLEKPQNYYELLGIPARGFQQSELKKAFRKASVKYHPDKNPDEDTTELFLEITNANNIIDDPKTRFAYDVYLQTNFQLEDKIMMGLNHKKMEAEERD